MTKKKGATHVAPNLLDIILITIDICMNLLADAKIRKDINQHVLRRNFTGDCAECINGFADVLADKVGREAGGETFAGTEEGSAGVGKGLDVALVCDEGSVAVGEEIAL